MKILVVYPRWTGSYGLISGYFARKSGGVIPPLNLALIAAIAREGGYDVSVIDADLQHDETLLVEMLNYCHNGAGSHNHHFLQRLLSISGLFLDRKDSHY